MEKNHPSNERTLVVIKPDGVQRTLIGEIIKRYEQAGLKQVAVKMLVPSEEHVEKHYMENLARYIIRTSFSQIFFFTKENNYDIVNIC